MDYIVTLMYHVRGDNIKPDEAITAVTQAVIQQKGNPQDVKVGYNVDTYKVVEVLAAGQNVALIDSSD